MRTWMRRAGIALAVLGGLALADSARTRAEDRKPDQILKEIKAVKLPSLAPKDARNQEAVQKYIRDRQEAMSRKAELIGELFQADPSNKELAKLLPERWQALLMTDQDAAGKVADEIGDALAKTQDKALKVEGNFLKAQALIMKDREHAEAALPAAEEFAKLAPKDQRAPVLFYYIANGMDPKSDERKALEDRILADYKGTQFASMIESSRRQREAIGKPFELAFTDAISGSEVSMETLKGKVVVVDFWATWCGPCVGEMPKMKKLYAEYKDKGVEFVGVSLDQPKDQGGLDELKDFVAKNHIGWPQYYQGKGWESEFSKGWGVNAIPCVFVVDADGKLYSTEARGKLETLIPELLEKAKKKDAGAGG